MSFKFDISGKNRVEQVPWSGHGEAKGVRTSRKVVLAVWLIVLATVVPSAAGPPVPGEIPQNPAAAPNGRSNALNDSYASQTYTWAGPATEPGDVLLGGFFGNCATVAFDEIGRILAVCRGGPTLELIDPATLQTLSTLTLPQGSSAYFYLTAGERILVPANRDIWIVDRVGEPESTTLTRSRVIRLSNYLRKKERIIGVVPDWEGRIWFLTVTAVVGYVEPATGHVGILRLGRTARVTNSLVTDETGGVFLTTTRALFRIDRDEDGDPVVTWREPYDFGTRLKPGQSAMGSGTTPTLLGDSHVAITDNADPHMHVLVYRRGKTPVESRLVCSVPVFGENEGATDNSLIATATSIIVENNYGYLGVDSMTGGRSTAPGITRIDLDPGLETCSIAWTNQARAPNVLPKLSLADGLVYTYTKEPDPEGLTDWWALTAIDFHTGQTTYEVPVGTGTVYDSNYAALALSQDGAVYLGVEGGLVRLQPPSPPPP
jgi:outer membrane protein assembly factor BamB